MGFVFLVKTYSINKIYNTVLSRFSRRAFQISAITCSPEYTTMTNGNVNCDGDSFSDQCLFSCNTGYQLVGDSMLTCISDGTDDDGIGVWNGPVPTCKGTVKLSVAS